MRRPSSAPSVPTATPPGEAHAGRRWPSTLMVLLLAWAPFAGLWILFVRIFVQTTLFEAVFSGFVTIGNAALLSIGVWWLTGRYPWPRTLKPSFYFAHVALGLAYAGLWLLLGQLTSLAFTGMNSFRLLVVSGLLGWRILMGLWLYGMVVAVSYAIRIGRRLVEQERVAAQAQALAVEARLEGIRSQLNPHFLFNALHTTRALIRTDPPRAREALEKLGGLLRYSLDRSSQRVVPLREEWSFVLDYLELERMRLGDRLRTRCDLSPMAATVAVPPFLIQPLVENAVIHGIAPTIQGGTLHLRATVTGGDLVIEIRDDGVGPTSKEGDPEGHGHRLIRERLEVTYGEGASVSHGQAPEGGYLSVLTLPAVFEALPARPAGGA